MKESDSASSSAPTVSLRAVSEDDLQTLYEYQLDPESVRMAAFPSRDWDAHMAHWHRLLADESLTAAAVLMDGAVAGDVVSWEEDGQREVGYWIGRAYWGKGIATAALSQFLKDWHSPPLHAHVAKHNLGSLRVLEKCGFTVVGESAHGNVDESILFLG